MSFCRLCEPRLDKLFVLDVFFVLHEFFVFEELFAAFILKTHYPFRRTWANIFSSFGYASWRTLKFVSNDSLEEIVHLDAKYILCPSY